MTLATSREFVVQLFAEETWHDFHVADRRVDATKVRRSVVAATQKPELVRVVEREAGSTPRRNT